MNNRFRPPESYLEDIKQTIVLVDYSNLQKKEDDLDVCFINK